MIAQRRTGVLRFRTPMAAPGPSKRSRDKHLAAVVAGIEKKFGVGALQRLGSLANTNVDVLPTGIAELESILGVGGWPRGRICEIFGPEGVGVTRLLLQALAAAQARGGIVAFVDVDHAFVPEYARRIGCVVEEIFIAQPDDGPMALEIVDALVRSGAFDLVVLASPKPRRCRRISRPPDIRRPVPLPRHLRPPDYPCGSERRYGVDHRQHERNEHDPSSPVAHDANLLNARTPAPGFGSAARE